MAFESIPFFFIIAIFFSVFRFMKKAGKDQKKSSDPFSAVKKQMQDAAKQKTGKTPAAGIEKGFSDFIKNIDDAFTFKNKETEDQEAQKQTYAAEEQPEPAEKTPAFSGESSTKSVFGLDIQETAAAEVKPAAQKTAKKTAEDYSYSDTDTPESSGDETASGRLNRLPDLKKAVIWSEILGTPKGLQ